MLNSRLRPTLKEGAFLESQDGTATFLARTAVLLGLSQGMLVALSHSERRLAGYGSGGGGSWLNDAVAGLMGQRRSADRGGGAEMLPFYHSGCVGFSGVNFALKAVVCQKRRANFVYLMGRKETGP